LVSTSNDGEGATGRVLGIVGRADDLLFGFQYGEDLAAAIGVVAERNAIDPGGEQFVVDGRRRSSNRARPG